MDKILEPSVKCNSEVTLEKRRETMPSEWNATQNEGIHVHDESTREFPHTTKWQRKGNDVTQKETKTLSKLCAY